MIQELQPKEVFSIFHEITQVPRPSKREGKIIEWLKAFAVKQYHHAQTCYPWLRR